MYLGLPIRAPESRNWRSPEVIVKRSRLFLTELTGLELARWRDRKLGMVGL
jgi:hypothetical protein